MAAIITDVKLTPSTVDTGSLVVISVGVAFSPLTFNDLDNATWDSISTNTWNDIDKTMT